jgi:AcrR family transcriptional regulator
MRNGRQAQSTREQLQHALIELIRKRNYDAITIQDIVARAGVGRTTFYLHYPNKDALFLGCHEAIVRQFDSGLHRPQTREEFLASKASPGAIAAYQHLAEARAHLNPILQGKEGLLLLRGMRERSALAIEASLRAAFAEEASLRAAFAEAESSLPIRVLANYLAGAQVSLVQWWLERRQPHSAEELAQTFHRLQRAAIYEALGLKANN